MDKPEMTRADTLALAMLEQARNALLLHLRYMGIAIGRLALRPTPGLRLATNGESIYYDASHVFEVYRQGPEALSRDYLHTVLHCIFSHPYVNPSIDRQKWDLACDMAVECTIDALGLHLPARRLEWQPAALAAPPETVRPITAEKLYRWLLDSRVDTTALRAAFWADDHSLWYTQADTGVSEDEESELEHLKTKERQGAAQEWQDIGRQIEVDLETTSHRQEGGSGYVLQNLREVTREKHDYTAFLRRFAVLGEELQLNPDEFDYVYYTYGLTLYKNLPLIEPLEYREVMRIKEFVVAIDTSGSVSGELVQQFIQKTYNILKQSESFSGRINLRIIQCDAEIREDVAIRSQEDFDAYLSAMQLRGFGGTDFRPVFNYVDKLIETGQIGHLGGLIYFTDGYGAFPEYTPAYETAFVFVDESTEAPPPVPVWAIRLVLKPHEL